MQRRRRRSRIPAAKTAASRNACRAPESPGARTFPAPYGQQIRPWEERLAVARCFRDHQWRPIGLRFKKGNGGIAARQVRRMQDFAAAYAACGLPGGASARHFDGAESHGAMVLDRAKPRERSEAILAALPVARGYPGLVQTAADIPDLAGAYVLVIDLAEPVRVTIGGHTWRLESGRYLYCGSAHGPGGLRARVARHMRRGKPVRWHADQLTERGRVRGALIFPGRRECALAARLAHLPVPIPGFGSSDCRRCASHLFAWPEGAPPWPALRRRGERRIQRSGPAPRR